MNGPHPVDRASVGLPNRVYIILVNWNGWRDTIECLESVFRLEGSSYRVLVCDNGSPDGSLAKIRGWAEGHVQAPARSLSMAAFTWPPVAKPIRCTEVGRSAEAESDADAQLVLIQTGANLGFAAANNIGIRYALAQADCGYFWLLNNDTVVKRDSLSQLIDRMNLDPEIGICGSTLLFYDSAKASPGNVTGTVQACGGSRFNPWTSRGGHIAAGFDAEHLPPQPWVERRLRYIVGASMLVSRHFVESVGYMNEQYFLYFEEIDWATRARGLFRLGYAPLSIVYHKTGATIGTAARPIFQSEMADYWGTRNRIAFTRKYFIYALPSVYFFVLCSALLRLVNRRMANFRAVVTGALLLGPPGDADIPVNRQKRK